jgi:hypothetical protein
MELELHGGLKHRHPGHYILQTGDQQTMSFAQGI